MAHSIALPSGPKGEQYAQLLPQLEALWHGEPDLIANMANTCAALAQTFHFHWVGFYIVRNEELVLGPFQGPVACTRIGFNKGVCGTAWATNATLVVPDVEGFPGHIACSALSRSEVVVPVKNRVGAVVAVLDIDSEHPNHFDEVDSAWLEKIAVGLGMH